MVYFIIIMKVYLTEPFMFLQPLLKLIKQLMDGKNTQIE